MTEDAVVSPVSRTKLAQSLEETLTPLMEKLLQNNTSSHNISSLVMLLEEKCQELRSLTEKDERFVPDARRFACDTCAQTD